MALLAIICNVLQWLYNATKHFTLHYFVFFKPLNLYALAAVSLFLFSFFPCIIIINNVLLSHQIITLLFTHTHTLLYNDHHFTTNKSNVTQLLSQAN